MKALVLKEYHRLVYEEVPAPRAGAGEVLIRVKACGICGSDVHGLDGSTGRRLPPLIMGHEAAGEIAALGPGIEGWREGERVTFDSTIYCGKCWHCRRGEINLCDNRRVLGVSCADYRQHGAYAEYVAVPEHVLYRLPGGVSFAQAAMVEALSVAVHAVARTPLRLGDTVLVVGMGTIGLLVLQVLRAAGCGRVIAVDIEPDRLALAEKLGAAAALHAGEAGLRERILALADGRGADVAIEAVGTQAAIQLAVSCLRKGGSLALIGNLASQVELPLQILVTREINLAGSCASRGEYPVCLDLIARRAVDVDSLISAVAPLAEGAAWFDRLYGREKGLMKVVLVP